MESKEERWNYLISEFCKLGGEVQNICQGEGIYGRGIFSINPSIKSKIYIPAKLMIRKEDIFLNGDNIQIKGNKKYSKKVKDFFDFYQRYFSWGGEGKEKVENFERDLSLFSPNLKKMIKEHLLIDLDERHQGEWDQCIFKTFINTRAFEFNGCGMVCPILELVNHEVFSLQFIHNGLDGISTPNYPPFKGELTHNYNNSSSIQRFFTQGFFCKETIAFSIPFTINFHDQGKCLVCRGQALADDSLEIEKFENTYIIKGLPMADAYNPKLPLAYFKEIISRLEDVKLGEEFFNNIIELNISMRKKIVKEAELLDNKVAKMLAEVLNYEISIF